VDNQAELTFWFDNDLDGTGSLWVEAGSNGFSGKGRAYFAKSQIEDFANALTAYPLKKESLPEIIGGFGDQENLLLKVYPINGKGDLAIQVKIATELWNEERLESQHFVQLEICTHYQTIADLSKELKDLINGRINKASLKNI
jgi:hypothetical protein